jgi:hypothetical protein
MKSKNLLVFSALVFLVGCQNRISVSSSAAASSSVATSVSSSVLPASSSQDSVSSLSSEETLTIGLTLTGPDTVRVGRTITLTADVTGVSDYLLRFSSDNTDIAVVNKEGVVTGISAGTAVIQALVNKDGTIKKVTKSITVSAPTLDLSKIGYSTEYTLTAAQGGKSYTVELCPTGYYSPAQADGVTVVDGKAYHFAKSGSSFVYDETDGLIKGTDGNALAPAEALATYSLSSQLAGTWDFVSYDLTKKEETYKAIFAKADGTLINSTLQIRVANLFAILPINVNEMDLSVNENGTLTALSLKTDDATIAVTLASVCSSLSVTVTKSAGSSEQGASAQNPRVIPSDATHASISKLTTVSPTQYVYYSFTPTAAATYTFRAEGGDYETAKQIIFPEILVNGNPKQVTETATTEDGETGYSGSLSISQDLAANATLLIKIGYTAPVSLFGFDLYLSK